jgi:hypothetical protein
MRRDAVKFEMLFEVQSDTATDLTAPAKPSTYKRAVNLNRAFRSTQRSKISTSFQVGRDTSRLG